MKIKAGLLLQLKTIMNVMIDKDFSFKRSMEIARFVTNQLEKEIQLIEQQRIKLCKEMSKKDDKGNPVMNANKTNYIISDAPELMKRISELEVEAAENKTLLTVEHDELLKKLEIEKLYEKEFQDKLIELAEVEVELSLTIFTEKELEKFNFAPRMLIVLGELGFIEGYKVKETENLEEEIKEILDFKVVDPKKIKK